MAPSHALIARPPAGVFTANELHSRDSVFSTDRWSLRALAGRFIEVSASPFGTALTATAGLILEAQRDGKFAVWIGDHRSIFSPPDFALSGIDLNALPVVRTPDALCAWRVADTLIRSAAFAVVVLDCRHDAEFPFSVQTRLAGLAKKHSTALVWIAHRNHQYSASSSLVSLRIETARKRNGFDHFACELRAVKDKHAAPGWVHTEECHGTDGLC